MLSFFGRNMCISHFCEAKLAYFYIFCPQIRIRMYVYNYVKSSLEFTFIYKNIFEMEKSTFSNILETYKYV